MANKLSGYPCTIAVESATPGTFTTIAAVLDIEGPNIEVEQIDFTSRDSNSWKEFVGGLLDGGEVTFDVLYDPDTATHGVSGVGLVALALARTVKNWKLTLSDATPTVWSHAGFIKSFKPKAPMKEALRASVSIKVTGAVTVA